jgi:hypothetical protein
MGRFSDNGFLMVHPQKVVTFYSWDGVTVDNLKAALSVKTLMNIYVEFLHWYDFFNCINLQIYTHINK